MKKSSLFLRHLGTSLIVLSLLGFSLFAYPLLRIYLFPPVLTPPGMKGTYLTIPKIHASSPVVLGVDPFNEAIYKEALHEGVAHAKGSSLPGSSGTSFLFAHSSGNPWELTKYNTIFLRLPELVTGDMILLTVDGKRYKYKVKSKKEVSPSAVSYLVASSKDQLILQTCTPIGTSLNRLLIFATPV